jgi:hypothetical protein
MQVNRNWTASCRIRLSRLRNIVPRAFPTAQPPRPCSFDSSLQELSNELRSAEAA